LGIEGYYVRIAPKSVDGAAPFDGTIVIKNQPIETALRPASATISPDALALVRFGLRRADDPRILNTITAIDHLLKVDLPAGPSWRRYNGDGYGEHADGSAFSGTGIGRAWPLLTGERAHYEIAAGQLDAASGLARTMERLSSAGGLIPEQVWDGEDIPERELYRGKPTGSAMPLVWAHAEYLKLRRSLADGAVFDRPPQTVARYLGPQR
jgi:glucoamylase